MSPELQKAGGFSAIALAACYLIGFAMFIFVLDSSAIPDLPAAWPSPQIMHFSCF
jgi:hypothetical protein